jgi:hypothetical protein
MEVGAIQENGTDVQGLLCVRLRHFALEAHDLELLGLHLAVARERKKQPLSRVAGLTAHPRVESRAKPWLIGVGKRRRLRVDRPTITG